MATADYATLITGLGETIDDLTEEVARLKAALHLQNIQSAATPPPQQKAPVSTSGPSTTTPLPAPPPPAPAPVGAPSWATVVRKGRKRSSTAPKPAPAAAKPTPSAKAPATRKGLTLQERKLTIKRDGSALIPSHQKIRDNV